MARRLEMEEAGKRAPRCWYGTVGHWQLYEALYEQIRRGCPEISEKEMEELASGEPVNPKIQGHRRRRRRCGGGPGAYRGV